MCARLKSSVWLWLCPGTYLEVLYFLLDYMWRLSCLEAFIHFDFFFPVWVQISLKPQRSMCDSLGKTVPCFLCFALHFTRLQHGVLQSNAEHASLSPIMMVQSINEAKINSFFLVHPAARQIVTSVLGVFHGRIIHKLLEMQIPAASLSMSSCGTWKSRRIMWEGLLGLTVAR